MKMILTSTGLLTPQIAQAFFALVASQSPKMPDEIKVAFIPTAAVSDAEMQHAEQAFQELISLGLRKENIYKVTLDHPVSLVEFDESDAIFVCGGNTFYLLKMIRESGFSQVLKEYLAMGKVYVGVSAGSIVVTPNISIAGVEPADPNDVGLTDFTGMNLVDFEVSPHVPEIVSYQAVGKYSQTTANIVLAFDHLCALLVENEFMKFIGDGRFKSYN